MKLNIEDAMRYITHFILTVIATLFLTVTAQADTISPRDAYANAGASITVEGVVSQVSTIKSGTTFINFGGRYPNHIFYGVTFRSDADQFGDIRGLRGKTIRLYGTIDLYKGKPQIILHDQSQIKVVQN